MRIYRYGCEVGRTIERFGSRGDTFSPTLRGLELAYAGCMYLEPQGIIGQHEASMDQLLLVVQGSGVVSGADAQVVDVEPGCAVFWERGEVHETRAGADGLVAVVVEGERLDPGASMSLWESAVAEEQ